MRITGGLLKGRQILFAKHSDIRPTTDKNRSAIFSILSDRIENANVLDVCCGTGAFGLESISRGAKSVIFIDKDTSNITKNIELIKEHKFKIIKGDFFKKISSLPKEYFDIIFVDPPYQKYDIIQILKTCEPYLKGTGIFILEESSRTASKESDILKIVDERIYGDTKVIFYKKYQTQK